MYHALSYTIQLTFFKRKFTICNSFLNKKIKKTNMSIMICLSFKYTNKLNDALEKRKLAD